MWSTFVAHTPPDPFHTFRHPRQVQRSEIARLTREKDVLHDRLREAENKLEGEKKAAGVYRRDVAAKLQAADHALKVRF